MYIKFNTSDEKLEELIKNYQDAKRELESYLFKERLELTETVEPSAVTDSSRI